MNEEQPAMEQPAEAPPVEAQRKEAHPTPPVHDPRRRLRELLAIPERDRTDPVWDEIISLEIETAPGNRAVSPQQDGGGGGRHQEPGRRQEQQGRRPEQQARRQGPGPGQGGQSQGQDPNRSKPGGRFFKKRKRGPGAPA